MIHAELEVTPAGAIVYLGQPPSGFRNPAVAGGTSLVYVLVKDVDVHCERAKSAGAKIVGELNDDPFGHRRYGCADPQGHEWVVAQPVPLRKTGIS